MDDDATRKSMRAAHGCIIFDRVSEWEYEMKMMTLIDEQGGRERSDVAIIGP
jgi:hypothetical protein